MISCKVTVDGRIGLCAHWSYVNAVPLEPVPDEMKSDNFFENGRWIFNCTREAEVCTTWFDLVGNPRTHGHVCRLELSDGKFRFVEDRP